jgi:hypothetical protein
MFDAHQVKHNGEFMPISQLWKDLLMWETDLH